jgi:hypothetical protein
MSVSFNALSMGSMCGVGRNALDPDQLDGFTRVKFCK